MPDELVVRVFYYLSVSDVPYFGVVSAVLYATNNIINIDA